MPNRLIGTLLPSRAVLLGFLKDSVDEVFSTMVATVAQLVDCDLDGAGHRELSAGVALEAVVEFEGDHAGAVVLACNRDGAEEIARGMLLSGVDEELSPEEVRDALGECANMVCGTLKNRALDGLGDFRLCPPRFVQEGEVQRLQRCGSLVYRLCNGAVSIEVWLFETAAPKAQDLEDLLCRSLGLVGEFDRLRRGGQQGGDLDGVLGELRGELREAARQLHLAELEELAAALEQTAAGQQGWDQLQETLQRSMDLLHAPLEAIPSPGTAGDGKRIFRVLIDLEEDYELQGRSTLDLPGDVACAGEMLDGLVLPETGSLDPVGQPEAGKMVAIVLSSDLDAAGIAATLGVPMGRVHALARDEIEALS